MKNKEEKILKREDGLLKNERSWRRARVGAALLFGAFFIAMLLVYRDNLIEKDQRAKALTAMGGWCFFWLLLISWLNVRIQYIDSINRYRKKSAIMVSNNLLDFIKSAQDNTFATFHNFEKTPVIHAMFTIDNLFREISAIKNNYSKELLLPIFVSRCHGAYLGAVRLITSGQVVETHMLLRGCIENALYAHFIQTDPTLDNDSPERMSVWIKRADDEQSSKDCRNIFSYGNLKRNLEKHGSNLANKMSDLYEQTLEYGAHPNVAGHITASDIKEEGGNVDILLPGSTDVCKLGLQTTVKVGVISLKLFELVYGSRFRERGVTEKLTTLDWAIEKT